MRDIVRISVALASVVCVIASLVHQFNGDIDRAILAICWFIACMVGYGYYFKED